MKAKIIHILCEGQTEQGFVEDVLRPYLQQKGVSGVKSILISTNKKKNARGGMLTYNQALTDLNILQKLTQDLQKIGNPELVNNSPETAPSKRIIKVVEGDKKMRYSYNKPKTGRYVTKTIGIDALRSKCRHFNEWIEKLISC